MQGKILVVDDSSINLSVIKNLTERLGLKTDAAKNPKSALKALSKNSYDIILSDYLMPEMNGLEFTCSVHSTAGHETTPVILLTSDFTDEEYLKFIEAGVNNVLIKPVSLELLKDALLPYVEDSKEEAPPGFLDVDKEYLELVSVFVESATSRLEVIETAFGEKDYNTYTVEVHAVKGESAMINESVLSEKALSLEKAGKELLGITPSESTKEELEQFIDKNTHDFLEMLDSTIKRLKAMLPGNKDDHAHSSKSRKNTDNNDKVLKYVGHALEALDEGDTTLAREWLVEIRDMLK